MQTPAVADGTEPGIAAAPGAVTETESRRLPSRIGSD
jgi:hypothetical protein